MKLITDWEDFERAEGEAFLDRGFESRSRPFGQLLVIIAIDEAKWYLDPLGPWESDVAWLAAAQLEAKQAGVTLRFGLLDYLVTLGQQDLIKPWNAPMPHGVHLLAENLPRGPHGEISESAEDYAAWMTSLIFSRVDERTRMEFRIDDSNTMGLENFGDVPRDAVQIIKDKYRPLDVDVDWHPFSGKRWAGLFAAAWEKYEFDYREELP